MTDSASPVLVLARIARKLCDSDGLERKAQEAEAAKNFTSIASLWSQLDTGRAQPEDMEESSPEHYLTPLDASRMFLFLKAPEQVQRSSLLQLFQTGDTSEKISILRGLIYTPRPDEHLFIALEGMRSNIETVFGALCFNNTFPEQFFTEQEWNQMVLKAVFIQAELRRITGVSRRGNAALSELLFQFMCERYSAGREVRQDIRELCHYDDLTPQSRLRYLDISSRMF